jgi:hypothetical protein
MAVTTFSDILAKYTAEKEEGKRKLSWAWFLQQARKTRALAAQEKISSVKAITDPNIPKLEGKALPNALSGPSTIIGKMLLFQYSPKGAKTLPFWDEFPLIFPINIYHDGYLGINLHYLPPVFRAQLMDDLYQLIILKDKMDEKTRLRISYKILQNRSKTGFYKPCIKRYLYNNVKSQWSVIPVVDWDTAMMLPLQRFHKASDLTVWGNSVKKV